MLTGILPAWDFERRRGTAGGLVAWTLEEIRRLGWDVRALERLHDLVDARTALDVAIRLGQAISQPNGKRVVESVLRVALPELPWDHVVIRTLPRFRILIPGDDKSPLPLHTDHYGGRPVDERNVWIGLTRARGTACLRVARLVDSLACKRIADCPTRPLEVDAGDVVLFTPIHVHGATTATDETRISLDLRLGVK
jgi:hypothetical protein